MTRRQHEAEEHNVCSVFAYLELRVGPDVSSAHSSVVVCAVHSRGRDREREGEGSEQRTTARTVSRREDITTGGSFRRAGFLFLSRGGQGRQGKARARRNGDAGREPGQPGEPGGQFESSTKAKPNVRQLRPEGNPTTLPPLAACTGYTDWLATNIRRLKPCLPGCLPADPSRFSPRMRLTEKNEKRLSASRSATLHVPLFFGLLVEAN